MSCGLQDGAEDSSHTTLFTSPSKSSSLLDEIKAAVSLTFELSIERPMALY